MPITHHFKSCQKRDDTPDVQTRHLETGVMQTKIIEHQDPAVETTTGEYDYNLLSRTSSGNAPLILFSSSCSVSLPKSTISLPPCVLHHA